MARDGAQGQAAADLQLRGQHGARRQGARPRLRPGGRGARPHPACRAQLASFKDALAGDRPLLVGCTQEAPLFEETRAEAGAEVAVGYVNIRERAGWAEEGPQAMPKIAALLAEAAPRDAAGRERHDEVGGRMPGLRQGRAGDRGGPAAVLAPLGDRGPRPARGRDPAAAGRRADLPRPGSERRGHLGAFELVLDGFAAMVVSSRQALAFERPRDGVATRFDLILDLTGGTPLFPAPAKRDGYFRPDPGNPAAVQRALFDLTDLVGEFEKPRYVDFKADSAPIRARGAPAARAASRSARPPRSRLRATSSRSTPSSAAAAAPATASARPALRPMPIRRPRRCSSACARCSAPTAKPAASARRSWCMTTRTAAR